MISSPREIADALNPLDLTANQLDLVLRRAADLDRQWLTMPPEEVRALARQMIARVALSADLIEVAVGTGKLARALGAAVSLENDPTDHRVVDCR